MKQTNGLIFLIYGIAIIVFGILIAALDASIEIIVAYFGIALGGILMGIGFLLDRAEHPKKQEPPQKSDADQTHGISDTDKKDK